MMIFIALPTPNLIATNHNAPTLIDRPFFSLFLFLPVSMIIGLGMLGMDRHFKKFREYRISNMLITVLTIYILLFPNPKVLRPLTNSILISKNDIILYQFIKDSLPNQALILIPNLPPNYFFGIDGGVWLEYATGLHVVRMAYNTDFASDIALNDICAGGADYMYVGNTPYSFSTVDIELQRDRYEPYISHEDVKLYKIVGCP